jgi:hypothetical protein
MLQSVAGAPRTATRRSTVSSRSGRARPVSARPALNPGLSLPAGGKRVLRSPPEGNAHPMRLSTENRRQTLSAA